MAYTVTQLSERGGAAYGVMVTLGSGDLRERRERWAATAAATRRRGAALTGDGARREWNEVAGPELSKAFMLAQHGDKESLPHSANGRKEKRYVPMMSGPHRNFLFLI
jgi:hypothetical protein